MSLKNKKYDIMILAGILFIAFGTFLMQIGNNGKSSSKIEDLESQLQERDEKIEKQSKIIHDSITGGDGFTFVSFGRVSKHVHQVMAFSVGKHIQKNVEITIVDEGSRTKEALGDLETQKNDEEPGLSIARALKNLEKNKKVYKIGNLIPNKDLNCLDGARGYDLGVLELSPEDSIYWIISITSNNGYFLQKFLSVPTELGRTYATQVWNQDGNCLHKFAPNKSLTNENGDIQWPDAKTSSTAP